MPPLEDQAKRRKHYYFAKLPWDFVVNLHGILSHGSWKEGEGFLAKATQVGKGQKSVTSSKYLWVDSCELGVYGSVMVEYAQRGRIETERHSGNIPRDLFLTPKGKLFRSVDHPGESS